MLGKTKSTTPMVETQTKISTVIGSGAVFDGNLTAPEAVRVDGTLNGNCKCEKNVVLGTEGQVYGNISAQNIMISGKVEGDIFVRGKLELLSTGRVTGNITARSLVIDEDAYFDGRCTMTAAAQEAPALEKAPAPKPAEKALEAPEEK